MNADEMDALRDAYTRRYNSLLESLAGRLERHLKELLIGSPRIDAVRARPKSIDRFLAKANKRDAKGRLKYEVLPESSWVTRDPSDS